MHGTRRIGGKAVEVVTDRRELESVVLLQPFDQPAGVVPVIAVGAAAVVVAVRVQDEERRVLRIETAGGDDMLPDLSQHARILQRAEAAARVLVADIALGRHADDQVCLAKRIDVLHPLGPQQRRRDLRAGPDVVQLQPVIHRRVDLLGRVRWQHALVRPGVGVVAARAEAMNAVVDLRQRRDGRGRCYL